MTGGDGSNRMLRSNSAGIVVIVDQIERSELIEPLPRVTPDLYASVATLADAIELHYREVAADRS